MTDRLLDLVNENDDIIGDILESQIHGHPDRIFRYTASVVLNEKNELLTIRKKPKASEQEGVFKFWIESYVEKGHDCLNIAQKQLIDDLGINIRLKLIKKILESDENESKFVYYYSGNYYLDVLQVNLDEIDKVVWTPLSAIEEFIEESGRELTKSEIEIIQILREYYN